VKERSRIGRGVKNREMRNKRVEAREERVGKEKTDDGGRRKEA
jgi:hypothetical protein